MKQFGRIAVCGGISLYNDKEPQIGLSTLQEKPQSDLAINMSSTVTAAERLYINVN